MKVTVTFGRTGVVVPCKEGWTVRDLIHQATQRYRKLMEQEGDFLVRTHHVEYCDGGILDPDDVLADLVEDKDKLVAVYEEQEAQQRVPASLGGGGGIPANSGSRAGQPSPEPSDSELSCFQPIRGGEIEVNSSALKSNTPLMVRSSSDSALGPVGENGAPRSDDLDDRPPPHDARTGVEERAVHLSQSKAATFTNNSLLKKVEISGEHGPLGIHVVPYCSSLSGRALGLHIRGVEENSRSKREGIFQDEECIVRINDTELTDKSFSQSQDVFRQAMRSPLVRLDVLPLANRERYERNLASPPFGEPHACEAPPPRARPTPWPAEVARSRQAEPQESGGSPEGRSPAPLPPQLVPRGVSGESPLLRKSPALPALAGFASRKGGKKLRIDLRKGPEGLGFTVVTRDSSVHGPGPILVKNILPRGAAVKDGRLQSGDRILEVNGVDITGQTQEELVAMLRSTKQGESVCLVVARQEEVFVPRELKGEPSQAALREEGKEQLTLEVPLNDSGSAGLGVSLKGNKSRETGEDLGIFIKSIIHGGAAYKDGRLRANDQLIAVNGESLLGRSNHEAMETLRRSMSMEGNVRGMIQLVVLRALLPCGQEHPDTRKILNRSFDSCVRQAGFSPADNALQPPLVENSTCECCVVSNGGYGKDEPLSPSRQNGDTHVALKLHNPQSVEREQSPRSAESPRPGGGSQGPTQSHHVKPSKSMDLAVSSEELGPTLGLKKSSSLESLQTAVSEAQRHDLLPFHRPRPHMVRGRGCNESFRAAIDKSYDGPPEDDDDEGSEMSSGRETPASGSSRQGTGDTDDSKKDRRKKDEKKKKKKKDKLKSKAKDKEKKKAEEPTEEPDKKTKKRGFGLLRFGKKKEEKGKSEWKASLAKQAEILSVEELERMKDERERIEAKHQELRGRQVRDRFGPPNMEDDDGDPNYARINAFKGRLSPSQALYGNRSPSPQRSAPHSREPSGEDPLNSLYAKVNKPRGPPPHGPDSMDRIQQLRREYQQALREGAAPAYEELEARRRGLELDPRVPVRSGEPRLVPRYEDVERQYASLPRRGPADTDEYTAQPWAGHRDPAHYASPLPAYHSSYPRPLDPRQGDLGFYNPPPPQRGPMRQDVPPSPPVPLRAPRYDTMSHRGFRNTSPERFGFVEGRHSDPRQKNGMTAAV
ncbi:partitioning defective 3 homolog B isoform X3 [Electrophorus electricus]|uniref:partitioning defective 3 homolog B isoform X3 n=1 Tax=Electrophorus electricus TaxID=8005 RepID=UPI0015D043B1|nr:partitioning defective 3 homolog B isoform X3 [Electrophorus electricus]